ncbi:MAG: hypothetical protein ACYC3S_15465 [Chloroflexota bacterium]
MKADIARLGRFRAPALGGLVLILGLLIGFTLALRSAPPPRAAALLWDDYILAVATLYQRDGDLAAARERLAKLATDNPVASVEALAAVYVPDGPIGESAAGALRNLAVALTGRSTPLPVALGAEPETLGGFSDPASGLRGVLRNQAIWGAVCALCLGVLGLTYTRRRPAALAVAPATAVPAELGRKSVMATSVQTPGERKVRPIWRAVQPVSTNASERRLPPSLTAPTGHTSISFTYAGGAETMEAITPILDPLTGRPIAGCGMTNGPGAEDGGEGYLGFLVWLHELGSREMPQTVGLLADGAGENCRGAVSEWADYARVDELVVARPGIIRTFETRRLRAAVSVTKVQQERVGRQHYRVLSHLAVRLDISFKGAPVRVPELVG